MCLSMLQKNSIINWQQQPSISRFSLGTCPSLPPHEWNTIPLNETPYHSILCIKSTSAQITLAMVHNSFPTSKCKFFYTCNVGLWMISTTCVQQKTKQVALLMTNTARYIHRYSQTICSTILGSFPGQMEPHSQASNGASFPGYKWSLIPRLQMGRQWGYKRLGNEPVPRLFIVSFPAHL